MTKYGCVDQEKQVVQIRLSVVVWDILLPYGAVSYHLVAMRGGMVQMWWVVGHGRGRIIVGCCGSHWIAAVTRWSDS